MAAVAKQFQKRWALRADRYKWSYGAPINGFIHWLLVLYPPNAPCMDHLPTLGEKWLHSRGNVLVNIPVLWSIWYL